MKSKLVLLSVALSLSVAAATTAAGFTYCYSMLPDACLECCADEGLYCAEAAGGIPAIIKGCDAEYKTCKDHCTGSNPWHVNP